MPSGVVVLHMAPRSTSFFRTGIPDAPLVQNAQTPFDGPERQVIDQQITDLQKLLATVLANGIAGTYAKIDANSPTISAGDVLCKAAGSLGTWTLATPDALAAAGGTPAGVALAASQPNSRCPVAVAGLIDPAITGVVLLSPVPYRARVSSAGRVEAVASYSTGDVPIGCFNAKGWLTLSAGGAPGVSTFETSTTTSDDNPTVVLSIPFSDNAAMTGTITVIALSTTAPGLFMQRSSGGVTYTSGGVLHTDGTPDADNTFNSFSPDPPSFSLTYNGASLSVDVVGNGLPATEITWSVRADLTTVIT